MRYLNAEAPPAATRGASKVHWNPVPGILAHVRQVVNRLPLVRLYHELQAARSLIAAYEQTAERRARQRRLLRGEKSSAAVKGGQR